MPARGGGFAAGIYALVALLGLVARLTLAATSPAGVELGSRRSRGLVTAWRLREEPDLVRVSLVLFLVLLVFAPGFGTQYAVWPLTLGVLTAGAGYFLCTVATMAWTLGSHCGVPGSGRWMGHVVWLTFVLWLVRETVTAARLAPGRVPAQRS